MTRATLTVQEIESAYLAHFDLGPGYPQLPVAPYIENLYLDDRIETLSLKFAPDWTTTMQGRLDADLEASAKAFLEVEPTSSTRLYATFSGSIALDRAITAALFVLRPEVSGNRIVVITTSPSIDIMRLFLAERPDIDPIFVNSSVDDEFRLNADNIISAIEAASPAGPSLVLLTSPENPTGEVWSAGDLRRIAETCKMNGSILLVDHCFLLSGVQDERPCALWDLELDDLRWLGVWDTGKTFGLNEDKLGFVASSPPMNAACLEALAVLQFGVPRRQKFFFAELFRQAVYNDHLRQMRVSCKRNLETLQRLSEESSVLSLRRPPAGSLALLTIRGGFSDEVLRKRLLSEGIGVVAANVFFHNDPAPQNMIRVALAREPDYFERAATGLFRTAMTEQL